MVGHGKSRTDMCNIICNCCGALVMCSRGCARTHAMLPVCLRTAKITLNRLCLGTVSELLLLEQQITDFKQLRALLLHNAAIKTMSSTVDRAIAMMFGPERRFAINEFGTSASSALSTACLLEDA